MRGANAMISCILRPGEVSRKMKRKTKNAKKKLYQVFCALARSQPAYRPHRPALHRGNTVTHPPTSHIDAITLS